MKKLISIIAVLALVLALAPAASAARFDPSGFWTDFADTEWDGEGTKSEPYLINSEEELAGLAKLVNTIKDETVGSNVDYGWVADENHFEGAYFQLTADLDLSSHYWVPIGNDFKGGDRRVYRAFQGFFDGGGHRVTGVTIDNSVTSANSYYGKAFGLFGAVGGIDLVLGYDNSGEGKFYYDDITRISDLSVSGSFKIQGKASGAMIGGVAGYACGVDFDGCTSAVTINLDQDTKNVNNSKPDGAGICGNMGGVVGDANDCSFISCVNLSDLDMDICYLGYDDFAFGGVVGRLRPISRICEMSDCVNNGNLDAVALVKYAFRMGGIAGRMNVCQEGAEDVGDDAGLKVTDCVNNGNLALDRVYDIETSTSYMDNNTLLGGICGQIGNKDYYYNYTRPCKIISCVNNGSISFNSNGPEELEQMAYDDFTCRAGGICGTAMGSHFEDCVNSAAAAVQLTDVGTCDVGGVVGRIQSYSCSGDTLVGCENYASVTVTNSANAFAGGVAGRLMSETMINCLNKGAVTISAAHRSVAGGLAGQIGATSEYDACSVIANSYNLGSVSATELDIDVDHDSCEEKLFVGGIAGLACTDDGNSKTKSDYIIYLIENCHSAGRLSIKDKKDIDYYGVGGIVGAMSGDFEYSERDWALAINDDIDLYYGDYLTLAIENCYWLEGCGADEDVCHSDSEQCKASKNQFTREEELLNWLNEEREETDWDIEDLYDTFDKDYLDAEACMWYIGDSGCPEFEESKVEQPPQTYGKLHGQQVSGPLSVSDITSYVIVGGTKAAGIGSFTDVSTNDWFYHQVKYAYENGIMDGVGGSSFGPYQPTTRAMVVTILYRLAGSPAVTGESGFSDVPVADWYSDAVIWAVNKGIATGYGDGTFGPNDPITREQLAAFIFRFAGAMGADVSGSASLDGFGDEASISAYAVPAVKWAVSAGIMNGKSGGVFDPLGSALRCEIAATVQRISAVYQR